MHPTKIAISNKARICRAPLQAVCGAVRVAMSRGCHRVDQIWTAFALDRSPHARIRGIRRQAADSGECREARSRYEGRTKKTIRRSHAGRSPDDRFVRFVLGLLVDEPPTIGLRVNAPPSSSSDLRNLSWLRRILHWPPEAPPDRAHRLVAAGGPNLLPGPETASQIPARVLSQLSC